MRQVLSGLCNVVKLQKAGAEVKTEGLSLLRHARSKTSESEPGPQNGGLLVLGM